MSCAGTESVALDGREGLQPYCQGHPQGRWLRVWGVTGLRI